MKKGEVEGIGWRMEGEENEVNRNEIEKERERQRTRDRKEGKDEGERKEEGEMREGGRAVSLNMPRQLITLQVDKVIF